MKDLVVKIKNYIYADKQVFAKGICFDKLFLIFIVGSIFGTIYEQLVHLVPIFIETGKIDIVSRTAVIYGQFNMIYGFGAVILIALLVKNDKELKWYEVLLYGALIGGGFEYLISFLQETFTGSVSWNYRGKLLNINGRTTIPYMFVWGLLSLLLIKVIYPFVSKLIEKIPYNLGSFLTNILVVLLSIDMLISWSAIIRQNFRKQGLEPVTFIGKFYDKVYPDSFMEKIYPNMKWGN